MSVKLNQKKTKKLNLKESEKYEFDEFIVQTMVKVGEKSKPFFYLSPLKKDPNENGDPSRLNIESNIKVDPKTTKLTTAVWEGDVKTAAELLKENPDSIHDRDRISGTPLICMAAQWNDLIPMLDLLIQYGADVNDISTHGNITPIGAASALGLINNVKYLYEKGANVEGRELSHPLFVASHFGHYEVVKFLVEHGADVNRVSKDGTTPICQAALKGHKKIVSYLLKKGAHIGPCENQITPLILASSSGHLEIVQLLQENGADLNYRGKDGATALFHAARNNKPNVVTFLASKGADPNIPIFKNLTAPLHIATQRGNKDMVQTLLKCNANPDCTLETGQTPLFLATNKGSLGIVKLLLNANADPHFPIGDLTPFKLAMKQKKESIYELMKEIKGSASKIRKPTSKPNTPSSKDHLSYSVKNSPMANRLK